MAGFAFLDFETDTEGTFFLAGTLIDGHFEQVILHPGLAGAARSKGLKYLYPVDFVRSFMYNAAREGRTIAAYTGAEREALQRILTEASSPCPSVPYCNLHKLAKRWINRTPGLREAFDSLPPLVLEADPFRQKSLRFSLASIMRLTSYHPPSAYHPGQTSARFRSTIRALERYKGDFAALTAVQKAKFTKALRHNEYDLRALPVLIDTAVQDWSEALDATVEAA